VSRSGWLGAIAALGLVAGGITLATRPAARPAASAQKPDLLLLSGLPLLFAEKFGLGDAPGAPVVKRIERDFRLVPIAAADPALLDRHRLLLMAQPRAQPAELLVALDEWVRRGGRVLILADPQLEWPSDKPLGDVTRPPYAFADTGLLLHWGVRLDGPDGSTDRRWGASAVKTGSGGTLVATGRDCEVDPGGFVARCTVGRGRAVIVADADMVDPRRSGAARATEQLLTELGHLATP
jgi:hypothetical protein